MSSTRSKLSRPLTAVGSLAVGLGLVAGGTAAGPATPSVAATQVASRHAPAPAAARADSPFTPVFSDEFDSGPLDLTKWSRFDGAPANGDWDKTHSVVEDGMLKLKSYAAADGHWVSGAVSSNKAVKQTYGKYEMRVRFDAGYGVRCVAELWPVTGWPPEVDFIEISANDTARTNNFTANHWKDASLPSGRGVQQQSIKADYTQWHDVGVEWTPTSLTYTLDGQPSYVITQHVPQQPMWMGIATALGSKRAGRQPNASTPAEVDLQIDWVHIYKYTPSA